MRSFAFAVALVMCACGPTSTDNGNQGAPDAQAGTPDAGAASTDARPVTNFPDASTGSCDKMDILFVIDDSGSMGQEQTNLATNFPQFITVLDSFTSSSGTPIDYRVSVTTTGVSKDYDEAPPFPGFPAIPSSQSGDDGTMIMQSGCNMPRRWLERDDANVSSIFECNAQVGTSGPAKEMPLEGARLALTDRMADDNAGFLRDDALLAVVILTDEDDCSRTDDNFTLQLGESLCDTSESVSTYVNTFDQVKGDRGRWATAIIAGTGPGSCSSSLGDAQEATRLMDFASQVGPNAVTSSICDGDLSTALADALAKFDEACQSFPQVD
jgi:hypothetical protein